MTYTPHKVLLPRSEVMFVEDDFNESIVDPIPGITVVSQIDLALDVTVVGYGEHGVVRPPQALEGPESPTKNWARVTQIHVIIRSSSLPTKLSLRQRLHILFHGMEEAKA